MMVETITLLKGSLGKKPAIIALRMGNRYLRKPNGKSLHAEGVNSELIQRCVTHLTCGPIHGEIQPSLL